MTDDDVDEAKRALRAQIRESRRAMGPDGAGALAPHLTANLVSLAQDVGATTVAAYLSLPDEPDTRGFLAWARANGVRVLLPIIRADGLLDWAEFDETETMGALGMPEPAGEVLAPNAIHDADLILVPASAVDVDGNRMGWGRGFFDKTLGSMEHCPLVYAVVYDSEVFDSIPHAAHDQPVDGCITPSARRSSPRN